MNKVVHRIENDSAVADTRVATRAIKMTVNTAGAMIASSGLLVKGVVPGNGVVSVVPPGGRGGPDASATMTRGEEKDAANISEGIKTQPSSLIAMKLRISDKVQGKTHSFPLTCDSL